MIIVGSRFRFRGASGGFYRTPVQLVEALRTEFSFTGDTTGGELGGIPLLDIKDAWSGVVWCNPPHGSSIRDYVERAADAAKDGAVVVMLLPASTDTS